MERQMGTAGPPNGPLNGPPGAFDIQNFFRTSPSPSHAPYNPLGNEHQYIPSSHPFPAQSSFPSLPGSFPLHSQSPSPVYHPYVHYPQENISRTGSYSAAPYHPPYSQSVLTAPSQHPSENQGAVQASVSSPPLDGARLMALLTTQSSGELRLKDESSANELPAPVSSSGGSTRGSSETSEPPPAIAPALPTAPPVSLAPSAANRLGGKLPKGRYLSGDHVLYDVDGSYGEAQPQLEVAPITVYGSDLVHVVGRQISVNKNYICYALRPGTIRVLNINTALRHLLRGHTQRVTDMAFFSDDVHNIASASTDGRIIVWKIEEEEGKRQITNEVLLAIDLVGDWESVHPLVCWHNHVQDFLVVGIGKYVLTIDVSRARMAAPGGFKAEEPIKCHIENPIEGVHVLGAHDAEVTYLSMPPWMITRVVSASKDGTVRIWGDKKLLPLATFVPHEGQPVGSVAFLSCPQRPEQNVLLTTGPLNRELKLWIGAENSQAGGTGIFQCIQTLELRSSLAKSHEEAFFNHMLVLPRASLIVLANGKKNAIYVVHVYFGPSFSSTRMDYLTEFAVTYPILSITATDESVVDNVGAAQIFCVQTQAIQQYTLDLSQCMPPEEANCEQTAALDKGLLSQRLDLPGSAAFPSLEASYQSISKSPLIGSKDKTATASFGSPVEVVKSLSQPTAVSSTNQIEHVRSELNAVPSKDVSISSKDFSLSKEMVEDGKGGNVAEASLISNVTPGLSPAKSRSRSPSKPHAEKSYSSTIDDQTDKAVLQEYLAETRAEALSEPVSNDLSALGTSSGEPLLKDETELQNMVSTSRTASVGSDQQGQIHLITPSELMSMARSKADSGCSSTALTSPSSMVTGKESFEDNLVSDIKHEETNLSLDDESLATETKVIAEAISLHPGDSTVKKAVTESSGEMTVEALRKTRIDHVVKESVSELVEEAVLHEMTVCEEPQQGEYGDLTDDQDHSITEDVREQLKEVKISEPLPVSVFHSPGGSKATRKNKNKAGVTNAGVSMPVPTSLPPSSSSSLSIPIPEGDIGTTSAPVDVLTAQYFAMHDTLNQLVAMQKDMQKQMTVMVAVPVAKEGKRMEGVLGQKMEKILKAHVDAMWAKVQEENTKREKLERERYQQLTTLVNSINKEFPASLERTVKKEVSLVGPAVSKLITPNIEKAISTAVSEALQKSINEKVLQQLEKSIATRLEASLGRQLQTQFQTSGRQALQDAMRVCFEASVIPSFERSCKVMFEQVDAAFQRGMAEYSSHAQQQFASSHTALASALQDTVASASSVVASLKGEIVDGQRKLVALAENAGASRFPFINKQPNGAISDKVLSLHDVEESLDPTIELSRLLHERKLEEAFNKALSLSDVTIVSWLCNQLDPSVVLSTIPLPLSQSVLLSLVQQLGCDLGKDTMKKVIWIREAALVLNPNDPVLAPHMRHILEQLYQNLYRQLNLTPTGEVAASLRLVIHVVNSLLTACK